MQKNKVLHVYNFIFTKTNIYKEKLEIEFIKKKLLIRKQGKKSLTKLY